MSDIDGQDTPADPRKDPHKPADDKEEVYFSGSPMIRASLGALFGWWIAGLVLLAIPIIWIGTQSAGPHWLVWLICIVGALLLFAMPVIIQKTVRYRISNYRIDYEHGLLSKSIETLELWHVDDIKYYQSFIDRLLSAGTITVMSHDKTTPQLVLQGVPNPRPVFESLKQRIIAVKRQRGVIKMDSGGGGTHAMD
jgi:membrane protein YdbS with pleckstrin-like domain